MFLVNILNIREKLLCLLFFALVPTVKAVSATDFIKSFVSQIIQAPIYQDEDHNIQLGCKPSSTISDNVVYNSFITQISAFIPFVSLVFIVAVYGTKSVFGYMATCVIDDIVLFSSSLVPILSWYTLVKPTWVFSLKGISIPAAGTGNITAEAGNTSENDSPLMLDNIPQFLVGSFLLIWSLTMIVGYCFHKRYSKHRISAIFFERLKTFIIWAFFFHSLEVITYSYLEYKFIFTKFYNISKLADTINLLFLNWFMNACYLLTSFFLVVTYHFPSLENIILGRERGYQGFIRKKTFFFTVTLSIIHAFFEYFWFCSAPFFNTIFIAIITTVLTRSISSFFSNGGEIKYIHKHGKEDKVYAQIEAKDIRKVKSFYIDDSNDEFSTSTSNLKKYRIYSEKDCLYAKKKETGEYFYVIIVDKSAFLDLDESAFLVNLGRIKEKKEVIEKIKCLIGEHDNSELSKCVEHGCEEIEQRKREIIHSSKNDVIRIKDYVFVNVLRTGFLSYIIYSHRGTQRKESIDRTFHIKYIIVFFVVIFMQCTLCALYALLVHSNDKRLIAAMVVFALFIQLSLYLLSRMSDSFKDTKSKSDIESRLKITENCNIF